MRTVWMFCGVALLALPVARTDAAVFCKKKNGAVFIREACKSKETAVNLASFGAVGPKGDKGDKGDNGAAGPLLATLPSGQSLTGTVAVTGTNAVSGASAISFVFPLASDPLVHIIEPGDPAIPECSGDVSAPAASPGHLCIFIGYTDNSTYGCYRPDDGFAGATNRGGVFYANPIAAGFFEVAATWAVTAP
jgi:hypothetical protein